MDLVSSPTCNLSRVLVTRCPMRSHQRALASDKDLLSLAMLKAPPRRHFIQRQKQIRGSLQERWLAAVHCHAGDAPGLCREVFWLARISVCAKSRDGPDPPLGRMFPAAESQAGKSYDDKCSGKASNAHLEHESRSHEAKTVWEPQKGCEIGGVLEWIVCLFHVSCKPEEIFRHLLLTHNHAGDAVIVT